MGHPKDIFKNRGPLTEQDIQNYLSGKLTDAQRRDIELKMAQDEFNMDAMEGFEEIPSSFSNYEKVQEKVHSNIRKNGRKWQFHHTIILSAILMAGTMLLGPYLFPDHGTNNSMPVAESTDEATLNEINLEEDVVVELSDEEIEAAIVLDELEIVHANEIITTSPVIIESSVVNDPLQEEIAIKESIEIKKVVANTTLENIVVPAKDEIIYSNVPLIYMKNFLLVDYSKIYVDPPTFEKTVITGTSAALENKEDQLGELYETNIYTDTIFYKDYLRETQEKFEQHDFKNALKRYKVILAKYPDDLNAHFYSGLCYFNIGNYDLAIQHFKIAKDHPYNTFQIDAEWYLAKTYCKQGKNAVCKELLQQIVNGGQFYQKQAQQLLESL